MTNPHLKIVDVSPDIYDAISSKKVIGWDAFKWLRLAAVCFEEGGAEASKKTQLALTMPQPSVNLGNLPAQIFLTKRR
jgi:hypothetical protein